MIVGTTTCSRLGVEMRGMWETTMMLGLAAVVQGKADGEAGCVSKEAGYIVVIYMSLITCLL